MGLLVVAAAEPVLLTLRGALEVLASQTALAVERVTLSQEVTRRNNEAYFRTLVQNAHDVILIVDDGGRIRYASPSAEAVLGPGSLLARPVVDLVAPADRDAAERAAVGRGRQARHPRLPAGAHGRGPHRRRGDVPRSPGRSDRPWCRAHHARRHRAAETGAGAHPPGKPRLAHRAREPGAVPGPRRAGNGRPDQQDRGRPPGRPRRLQARQRHDGPRDRRRAPGRRGRPPHRDPASPRPRGAARWGRVRDPDRGRRARRRDRGDRGANRRRPCRSARRRKRPGHVGERRRGDDTRGARGRRDAQPGRPRPLRGEGSRQGAVAPLRAGPAPGRGRPARGTDRAGAGDRLGLVRPAVPADRRSRAVA